MNLRHRHIDYLLTLAVKANPQTSSFGSVRSVLSQQDSLRLQNNPDFHQVFFLYRNNSSYSLCVEPINRGLVPDDGGVKNVEVHYFGKNRINSTDVLGLKEKTDDLERIFSNARIYELGLEYVSEMLQQAGLRRSEWRDRTASLICDATMSDLSVAVTINLREVPLFAHASFCREWELQVDARFKPVFSRYEPEKKKSHQCYNLPLFAPAAVARP